MLKLHQQPTILEIRETLFSEMGVRVFIKREDLIHPLVSGNKWRKLKYNLEEAKDLGHKTLLTFGGAFSNHIYATAAAAREAGFKSIGIIRGDELEKMPLNPTLSFAQQNGMQLCFITRGQYRQKTDKKFIDELHTRFGEFYLLPEGGTNNLAIEGCREIVNDEVLSFDKVCVSLGTGGTICGLISAAGSDQEVIGFSSLKGDFLIKEVEELLTNYSGQSYNNWHIVTDYHFGGYAKSTEALTQFIEEFERAHNILLDPIYTGKMMFGIYDKIKKGEFNKGCQILAIHTGGLQGRKLLPLHRS